MDLNPLSPIRTPPVSPRQSRDPAYAASSSALASGILIAWAVMFVRVIVEVHTDPGRAWCDGDQSIDVPTFRNMMAELAGPQEHDKPRPGSRTPDPKRLRDWAAATLHGGSTT